MRKEKGEGCPRNTRKNAKRRKENLRGILRTMPSFFSKPSEPFMFRLLEGSCLQLLRRCKQRPSTVAGVASAPSFPSIHFAFFRVFRGQSLSSLLWCPFAYFVG